MLSQALARQLTAAGLPWQPSQGDYFAVLDAEMDDDIFVLAEQSAFVQMVNGVPAIAFHGTSEWALDFVVVEEVTWLPNESQLREALAERLPADHRLALMRQSDHYSCVIGPAAAPQAHVAATAEDAYALALLAVLGAA